MTEREFQAAVMELAQLSGWETLHCRTSMQQGRYLTATTGTMAKGWPDLVLVNWRRGLLLFVELKGDRGRVTPDQERVHEVLIAAGLEVEVWHPKDWPYIEATLTSKQVAA
jgi:hypothetical protein